jgi:hypothetical protein
MADNHISMITGLPGRARMGRAAAGLFGTLALSLAAGQAEAQSVDSTQGIDTGVSKVVSDSAPGSTKMDDKDTQRLEESYQPEGLEIGQFHVFPNIELRMNYDSNVYATKDDAKGDGMGVIRPQVTVRSDFDRHALNLLANATINRHFKYGEDDVENYLLDGDGRIDVTDHTTISAVGQFMSQHEPRGSDDAVNGAEPTPFRFYMGGLTGKTESGRWTYSVNATAARSNYDDVSGSTGIHFNNDDRDRTAVDGFGQVAYEFSPGYEAIGRFSANRRMYDQSADDNGFERDSYGIRAETGLGLDLGQVVRGEILAGYLFQDYKDERLSDPSGLSVRATVNWTPDKATLVVPSLLREVRETTTVQASSIVRSAATLLVRREVQRNIILTGFGTINYDEYQGTSNDAITYSARARVTYAFNRNMYTAFEVGQVIKDSDFNNGSYNQTQVGMTVGFQY